MNGILLCRPCPCRRLVYSIYIPAGEGKDRLKKAVKAKQGISPLLQRRRYSECFHIAAFTPVRNQHLPGHKEVRNQIIRALDPPDRK
jgi:hypothetical protein